MLLTFDRGDPQRPKGHALLYFRSWSDPSAVFATYLIVPPIAVEISKYIPPMFASQFQQMGGGGIAVFPYPPVPERVESQGVLAHIAEIRDDDLVSGGSVDTASPERLLHAAAEAAQLYFRSFSAYVESVPIRSEGEALEETGSVDVNEVLYELMSERDRLAELSKLTGQLRYALGVGDSHLAEDASTEARRLARYLPEKYRADEIIRGARRPGAEGDRLLQLYLERAYRLADEDYEAVRDLEARIRQLE
mgnify:CR=1 FL=1